MARKKKPHWARKLLKWFASVLAVFVGISILLVLPLRWFDPATTAFMLRDDNSPIRYEWVSWSEMNSAMPLAVVASEDQRFADHYGIDFHSIRKSLQAAEDGSRLRGASTITQQLAKNLYLSPNRSFFRKGVEAWFAILLETCLGKKRILEIYSNIVELGPGIYGVGAASQFYFNKSAAALTDAEAALFAAVLPNPARLRVDLPSPYVRKRQGWINSQMQRLRRESWLLRLE